MPERKTLPDTNTFVGTIQNSAINRTQTKTTTPKMKRRRRRRSGGRKV